MNHKKVWLGNPFSVFVKGLKCIVLRRQWDEDVRWKCEMKMWDENVGWRCEMKMILHKIELLIEGIQMVGFFVKTYQLLYHIYIFTSCYSKARNIRFISQMPLHSQLFQPLCHCFLFHNAWRSTKHNLKGTINQNKLSYSGKSI